MFILYAIQCWAIHFISIKFSCFFFHCVNNKIDILQRVAVVTHQPDNLPWTRHDSLIPVGPVCPVPVIRLSSIMNANSGTSGARNNFDWWSALESHSTRGETLRIQNETVAGNKEMKTELKNQNQKVPQVSLFSFSERISSVLFQPCCRSGNNSSVSSDLVSTPLHLTWMCPRRSTVNYVFLHIFCCCFSPRAERSSV